MDLFFHHIQDISDPRFVDAMIIYNDSFPSNERQPLPVVRSRIEEKKSALYTGLLNKEVVCMALLWNFKDMEFVLLDYFAVKKEFRNRKIGTAFFRFLSETVKGFNKYMIMEVEDYLFGGNTEERKKRINFYTGNGAYILNDTPYILPSLDNTLPTEMLLMISPEYKNNRMEGEGAGNLITRLYTELYGKTENDPLLISILEKLPDKITFTNKIIL